MARKVPKPYSQKAACRCEFRKHGRSQRNTVDQRMQAEAQSNTHPADAVGMSVSMTFGGTVFFSS